MWGAVGAALFCPHGHTPHPCISFPTPALALSLSLSDHPLVAVRAARSAHHSDAVYGDRGLERSHWELSALTPTSVPGPPQPGDRARPNRRPQTLM